MKLIKNVSGCTVTCYGRNFVKELRASVPKARGMYELGLRIQFRSNYFQFNVRLVCWSFGFEIFPRG